ncbi:MAG: hypothetical protein ABIH11_01550 [Candidatus Altiarchaeota archaeon]
MSKYVAQLKADFPQIGHIVNYDLVPGGQLDRGEVRRVLDEAYEVSGGLFTRESAGSLMQVFDDPKDSVIIGAKSDKGVVLGMVFGVGLDDGDKSRIGLTGLMGDSVVECAIFVRPMLHRSAVGSRLYDGLMGSLDAYDSAVAITHRDNVRASRFFESKGFGLTPSSLLENVVYLKRLEKGLERVGKV